MKTKYVCDTCGVEFGTFYDAELHERKHKRLVIQYTDNKPLLGKAVLEAVVKEHSEEVPGQVLISYNGKHAWYKLRWLAPWEDVRI